MNNQHSKEIIFLYHSSDIKKIQPTLLNIRSNLKETFEWITVNQENFKTNEMYIYSNFLKQAKRYLDIVLNNWESYVEILAFSTRCLYELSIQLNDAIEDTQQNKRWLTEKYIDHLEISEAVKNSDKNNELNLHEHLNIQIKEINSKINELKISYKNPLKIYTLAKNLGREDEHKTIYKLLNKFAHPSSYLVNSPREKSQNIIIINFLFLFIQEYAWDINEKIRLEIGMNK